MAFGSLVYAISMVWGLCSARTSLTTKGNARSQLKQLKRMNSRYAAHDSRFERTRRIKCQSTEVSAPPLNRDVRDLTSQPTMSVAAVPRTPSRLS
jgi:hypothetical protein